MFTPEMVHIDQALSNLSVQFKNNALIAEQVLPVLPVAKESDKYFVYGKEAFKLVETRRKDGAEANEASLSLTTASYAAAEHALRDIVTDRARANADAPISPDADTTEFLTDLILLRLEKEVADLITTTGNYTNSNTATLSGTSQWNDYANSTPLTNFKTAKATVRKLIGKEANSLVLAGDVAETLSLHPDIKDLRKYTDSSLLTDAGLPPKVLGLKIIEGKATENVAYEGLTASMSYLWGKNAAILYIAERPGIKTLSFGYTLRVKGFRKVKKWRVEERDGDMVQVADMFVAKEVADECGYLLANAIA